jgi:hypothetical protein
LFDELKNANKNYLTFEGIDWAAYVKAEDRKERRKLL